MEFPLKIYFIFLILFFTCFFLNGDVLAQQISSSSSQLSTVCTKVGDPTTEIPAACKTTPGTIPAGNFIYYCQGDPKWDNRLGCGTGQIGCGPTSVAMIMAYFGEQVTPADIFKTYTDNGLLSCALGSFPAKVNEWLTQRGYEVGPNIGVGILDAGEAKKYIDSGWIILGSSDNFIGQKGKPLSHIFVVQDVDPAASRFTLRDPENCSYSTGQEFSENINQPITGGKVPSWKYAYPIRKKGA